MHMLLNAPSRRLAYNICNAITNFLFVFCGRCSTWATVIVCGLNGLPLGAKFLSDVVLSDVIDYDEMLTGMRHEASFTVFKQLLPGLVSIPAMALPVSVVYRPSRRSVRL